MGRITFYVQWAVSAVLVTVSVALWLMWAWDRSGGGLIIFYFWALLTFLVTIPSVLITSVMWAVRWHREPPPDDSLHLR
jgi:hypothetical protein